MLKAAVSEEDCDRRQFALERRARARAKLGDCAGFEADLAELERINPRLAIRVIPKLRAELTAEG